jgi:predicted helicase
MFVRFFRAASDRIGNDGIVAFITNRSFVDKANFDGFRRAMQTEFSEGYVIDLGGDYKAAGTAGGGNVFGTGTGVAVSFWIRRQGHGKSGCRIRYYPAPLGSGDDKLAWLANSRASDLKWTEILPHEGYWVDHPSAQSVDLIPLATKGRPRATAQTIVHRYAVGISSNRDDWVYDPDCNALQYKIRSFIRTYDAVPQNTDSFTTEIKWSETLKRSKKGGKREDFAVRRCRIALYRPFSNLWLYQSNLLIDRPGLVRDFFPIGQENQAICFSDPTSQKSWSVLAIDRPADLHLLGAATGAICVARRLVTGDGAADNLTDWAVTQFRTHYTNTKPPITKDAILHYVYVVLHDPIYRETYAQDLKRSFPRIPFYPDFHRWAEWGERLMHLHINFETIDPYPLRRTDTPDKKAQAAGQNPEPLLKPDRDNGIILIDTETQLSGIPAEAWTYILGNRSALDWGLDQHKQKTPKDPTIRAKFHTYRFADHKERVIDLLARVTRVSLETVSITTAMKSLPR